ncbi:DUF2970 domain-containing protein [Aliidiomarina shirensis]|nr:DUF2970 domain-containing protein [Aliidiomarina shirensis]
MHSENSPANNENHAESHEKPGLWAVVMSVLAAMFGVQTEANRRRDFSSGNPMAYIVIFVIFLALFVLTIAGIVTLVISLSS